MNRFVLRKNDGSLTEISEFPNVRVVFSGDDSTVTISESGRYKNIYLRVGSQSRVDIDTPHEWGLRDLVVDMGGNGLRKTLKIGKNVFIASAKVAMQNESDMLVEIGDDCLLSSEIVIRPGDGHLLMDKDTGEVLNRTKPIVLERKVWVGSGATILKGARLAPESVVATMTVVPKGDFPPNVVLAGNPARIVRENVKWSWENLPTD